MRRSAFEQVGLFRPYLTTGGDADLCWRVLRETDWQLHFAETAIVRHRHRATLNELRSQWRRYGKSNRYLHELHGVDLMHELSLPEYRYRLIRWLVKELPIATAKTLIRQAALVDMVSTPIGLICAKARATGQQQAKLPDSAKQIDRLTQDSSKPLTL